MLLFLTSRIAKNVSLMVGNGQGKIRNILSSISLKVRDPEDYFCVPLQTDMSVKPLQNYPLKPLAWACWDASATLSFHMGNQKQKEHHRTGWKSDPLISATTGISIFKAHEKGPWNGPNLPDRTIS